jgi:hypothetical protein
LNCSAFLCRIQATPVVSHEKYPNATFSSARLLRKNHVFLIGCNKAPGVTPGFTSVASITGSDGENALSTNQRPVPPLQFRPDAGRQKTYNTISYALLTKWLATIQRRSGMKYACTGVTTNLV